MLHASSLHKCNENHGYKRRDNTESEDWRLQLTSAVWRPYLSVDIIYTRYLRRYIVDILTSAILLACRNPPRRRGRSIPRSGDPSASNWQSRGPGGLKISNYSFLRRNGPAAAREKAEDVVLWAAQGQISTNDLGTNIYERLLCTILNISSRIFSCLEISFECSKY